MWYSTQKKEKSTSDKAYEMVDQKDTELIKKHCPEVVIEGVTWWDTTGQYLENEVKYLRLRGLIVIHPNHVLVTFRS